MYYDFKDYLAKAIRIISVPPILISALLIYLYVKLPFIFNGIKNFIISIVFLGVLPIIAYPIQQLIPSLRNKGRNMQRKIAFFLTIFGYMGAFIWGKLTKANICLQHIFLTYFLSVIILSITNIMHIKSSGHACSTIGVLLYSIIFFNYIYIPSIIVFLVLVAWSSIYLKRHTLKEIIIGSVISVIAFTISCKIYPFNFNIIRNVIL